MFILDVVAQHIIGPKIDPCLTISFSLMLSVWPTVVSTIISAWLLYNYYSISIRITFSHNFSTHFSAPAKNRYAFSWLCLCFSMTAFIIMMLSIVDLFFFSEVCNKYWTCCFVLSHSGSSLQFHKLWTLYLWWKYLLAFLNFFFWSTSFVVTLLMSLSIVTVFVLLLQICWILLLDFLSSHLLLLLAILLSTLTSLDLFSGLLFSPLPVLFFFFQHMFII